MIATITHCFGTFTLHLITIISSINIMIIYITLLLLCFFTFIQLVLFQMRHSDFIIKLGSIVE